MDVIKPLILVSLSLFLINCDQRSATNPKSSFTKTGTPGCDNQSIKGEYLVHWKNGDITVEHAEDDETFVEGFIEAHKDEIITSEPHYRIQVEDQRQVNQRGWGGYPNWGVDIIGAQEVWDRASSKSDIVVAVIDSGLDINHPELTGALYKNPNESFNGLDDDGNGLVDDVNGYDFVAGSGEVRDYTGHGTHVAGTISAQHDVGQVLGVAPNVKVLPLAFISQGGGGSVNAAINSIRYAVQQKAKVINASWGGDACSTLLQTTIEDIAKDNVLFVTAAGNRGNNIDVFPEYPAAFEIDNMVTVGASAPGESFPSQAIALFSNYGDRVDLMAPGAAITSTYPPEFDHDGNLDGVVTIDGTSMATPHVAGAAALLWSFKPSASYAEIKQALFKGVQQGPFRVKTRGSLYLPDALKVLEE